ncbi:MAG: ATP-binding protein [Bacteroidales bacterium]|nr:ATP-binding protein [Bacteroidales bacterium]
MITRTLEPELKRLLQTFSVVILTGPRQSGKTTLCQTAFPDYYYCNLEDVRNREMLQNDAYAFLNAYEKIIIDEAHHLPELFPVIQVLADKYPDRRFILTGSSNFSMMEKVTQSLAGRAAVLTLLPLSIAELNPTDSISTTQIVFNGGYPAVWGKGQNADDVYRNYYSTYIERDIRRLLNVSHITEFQKFMRLCAGRVGCEFVASNFTSEIGVSVKTVQSWLNLLTASYIVFLLPPFFSNINKRIIKTPKLYFYDTGLACFLLGISQKEHLSSFPLYGNLFENMVVSDFMKRRFNAGKEPNLYFYRDRSQNEVDIVEETSFDRLNIYEIKSAHSFHNDFCKSLNYFKQLFTDKTHSSTVIYDGELESESDFNAVVNFRHLK